MPRPTQPGRRRPSRGSAGPVARPEAQVLGQPHEQRTGNERPVLAGTDVVDGEHDVAAEKSPDVGRMTAVQKPARRPVQQGAEPGVGQAAQPGPGSPVVIRPADHLDDLGVQLAQGRDGGSAARGQRRLR